MQEIKLTIKNIENTGAIDEEKIAKYQEIFNALVTSGGLDGIRGGKTIIHFDAESKFQGVQLDYWPWRRRKNT